MTNETFRRIDNLYMRRAQESVFYDVQLEGREDTFLSGISARADYYMKLDCHMLIEDVSLGIMPIDVRSDNNAVQIRLDTCCPWAESLVISAIGGREYSRDIVYPMYQFFGEIAQKMIVSGEAFYEIVCVSKNEEGSDQKDAVGMRFVGIPSGTVSVRRGKFVQYLPEGVAERLGRTRRIQLTPDRIVVFRLPTNIRKMLAAMMEHLSFNSDNFTPEFAFRNIEPGTKRVPYDYRLNSRTRQLALAQSTKAIGYNRRQSFQSEMTEFYILYRHLAFERFKIQVRTHIHTTFNEMLSHAGKELGFSAQLRIEGLPELADVEKAQEDLARGAKPFKDIMAPFLGMP